MSKVGRPRTQRGRGARIIAVRVSAADGAAIDARVAAGDAPSAGRYLLDAALARAGH